MLSGILRVRLVMYFVYLLRCDDGSLYCGITTDLVRRLEEHKQGKGAKYTRGRKAGTIVYFERKRNRSTASKREVEIKSWTRAEKLALIRSSSESPFIFADRKRRKS